jgi:transcriptional regulator with XRE-family HTH domain
MTKHLGGSTPGDSAEEHENSPKGPDLADRIRKERTYVGLSQADVAEALGISRAAVSALETGKRRVTGLELGRMAELFGTSVDRLLGRDVPADETTTALFRATKSLTEADKEQVLRFAEFLRGAGKAPAVELPQDIDE